MAAGVERVARDACAHGPGRLYAVVRVLASLGLRSWFRLHAAGVEHIPECGYSVAATPPIGKP